MAKKVEINFKATRENFVAAPIKGPPEEMIKTLRTTRRIMWGKENGG